MIKRRGQDDITLDIVQIRFYSILQSVQLAKPKSLSYLLYKYLVKTYTSRQIILIRS